MLHFLTILIKFDREKIQRGGFETFLKSKLVPCYIILDKKNKHQPYSIISGNKIF